MLRYRLATSFAPPSTLRWHHEGVSQLAPHHLLRLRWLERLGAIHRSLPSAPKPTLFCHGLCESRRPIWGNFPAGDCQLRDDGSRASLGILSEAQRDRTQLVVGDK